MSHNTYFCHIRFYGKFDFMSKLKQKFSVFSKSTQMSFRPSRIEVTTFLIESICHKNNLSNKLQWLPRPLKCFFLFFSFLQVLKKHIQKHKCTQSVSVSQSLPCTFFILQPHFSSANLPSSSFCHPLFCSFDPLLTQSSSHTLLFIFIFFHPLPIICHFICLQTTLFLLSTFITPFSLSQAYLTDLAPDFTTLT